MRVTAILILVVSAIQSTSLSISEQLTYMDYGSVISMVVDWETTFKKYVSVEWMESSLPNRELCKIDGNLVPCRYPILKFQNKMKPRQFFSNVPQFMIIAGMAQNDRVGTSAVMKFLSRILNIKERRERIFSSLILIVIPILDPSAWSGAIERSDHKIFNDFPLFDSDGKCFNTNSAHMIDKFYKNNLISMTLIMDSISNLEKLKIRN